MCFFIGHNFLFYYFWNDYKVLTTNKKTMKQLFSMIAVAFLLMSCNVSTVDQNNQQTKAPASDAEGVFIHITKSYSDAHRVLMPMKMAVMMAKEKDVLVYLDIDAVELVVKDAEDITHDGFDSFQTYLSKLNEMNVGVYACPTCLKVAGFESGQLAEGVQTANKDKFFNFTDGRIITLDY